MWRNNYDFFITRLMVNGVIDDVALQNVQNAKSGIYFN
jgi:hypothetical protein